MQFPFATAPGPGECAPLLPGISWVRQPLPFALDHVNCWLLDDGVERALIDTGIASEPTRGFWRSALDGVMPTRLLVTHFHPDHIGLAGWFAEQGASVTGHPEEFRFARDIRAVDDARYAKRYADWYLSNGVDAAKVASIAASGNGYRRLVGALPATGITSHLTAGHEWHCGERVFRAVEGRGHAAHMLLLHDVENALLIAADQVLPTISPNVSLMPMTTDPNPLASFLDSLDELRALPEETLVLPSHGLPFRGLHARLDALTRHHEERLLQVLEACVEVKTAADLFPILFKRELDAQQLAFALGESLAHLVWLVHRGELECEIAGSGATERTLYRRR